ncbi:MAG: FecR domain-containing protein [Cytophagales bacterium]|nr:FecR domain-containing protein [Cytophagales bacterium]
MDYLLFTATDFSLDEHFQRWVLSPDEETHAFWDTWLLQHPEKTADVETARRLIQSLRIGTEPLSETQRHRMHRNIMTAVQENEETEADVVELRTTNAVFRRWRVAAAVLLGTLGLAGTWYWYANRPLVYQTAYGETRTLVLPDQSKVVLNANSELRVRKQWQADAPREVWLDGEAYFEVTEQLGGQAAKFKVYTRDLTVEVLGTRFNVAERDKHTDVTLNEGKVRLNLNTETAGREIMMQPGEMVRFSENGQRVEKAKVKAEDHSSWTKNYWVLDNTTLADIAARIEATYGYQVEINDSELAGETLSGVLPTQQIDSLLEVLAISYDVKVRRENTTIAITR